MSYTQNDLFDFMRSKRRVKVTTDTGSVHIGRCWAYGAHFNDAAEDIPEASLEVGDVCIYLHEIEKIEYVD